MPITKVNSLGITNPVAFSAGTVSLPSITTSGDTNTGAFFPAADTIAFTEGGAEAMRISSNGCLSINTTATSLPLGAARFLVQGGSSTEYAGIDQYAVLEIEKAVTGLQYAAEFRNPNGVVGRITTDGSATAYVTSSDYRLKENVNYNFDATTRLKQLKPARFNFKTNANKTVDGFLAHEVSEIVPEAIVGTKDEIDFKGNPVHQGIDQSKLTPILTKALQEAIAKIESLEARLTALESK
jgi:hypothetical protein